MHPAEPLQRAAAHALAHLVARDGHDPAVVLQALQETYDSKLPVSPAPEPGRPRPAPVPAPAAA